ncbi:MAG: hypothetical protein GY756_04250 [bacterium]|nr:hypothetical protein [bacterium]
MLNINTSLKKKISDSDKTLIGAFLTTSCFELTDIFSKTGFDFLWIDMEHGTITIPDLYSMVRICSPTHTIVRIPSINEGIVKRVLDSGTNGIMAPSVNTAEQVEYLVELSKYHPLGKRAAGPVSANFYGMELSNYFTKANENVMVIIQIETLEGYNNLDKILSVKGLDGIFIGPFDLSVNLEKPGCMQDPEVENIIKDIVKRTKKAGINLGIYNNSGQNSYYFKQQGFDMVGICSDTFFIAQSVKALYEQTK